MLEFKKYPLDEHYFVIDDSPLPKWGRSIENVSFIYAHNLGHSVLGFSIVTLSLFTGQNFYHVDFAYRFGKTYHPKSPEEIIGDPRSISGQMSYEAKHRGKVKLSSSDEKSVIVFAKGYHETEDDTAKGKKNDKGPKWVAFHSTDTRLHSSNIIKKYTKRWTIEVFFKECKQLIGLGKDQSNDFNAQVFSTTVSFLQYNLLNFLNEKENYSTIGDLFQDLADESAIITYAHRLWDFFRSLFEVTISKIFDLFKIEEECSSYINEFTQVLYASTPFKGYET